MPLQANQVRRSDRSGIGLVGILMFLLLGVAVAGACFAPVSFGFN